MPRFTPLIIPTSIMNRDPVIPQRTSLGRPAETNLNIDALLVYIEEVVQQNVAFRFIQPDNAFGEGAVDEEAFPACGRVDADDGVDALDMFRSGVGIVLVEVCVSGFEDGFPSVDDFAEARGEFLVGAVAACPERVAADGWDCVVVQVCYTGWLAFVDQIGVPAAGTAGLAERGAAFGCLEGGPDYGDAFDAWDLAVDES